MKYLIVAILIALPIFAGATIYQMIDSKGNVYYTDQPSDKAKPVDLDSTGISQNDTATAKKDAKKDDKDKDADDGSVGYEDLRIVSPKDQETIQNEQSIPVTLSIKPKLLKGDKVAIFLDGKSVIEGAATDFLLNHPDRGQHTVQAKIFGADGNMKKESSSITIFVHYASIYNNPALKKS